MPYILIISKKKKKISRLAKKNNKRELLILNFMKKTDVFYHHHNSKESLKKQVLYQIDVIKKANSVVDYVEDVHEGYVGYSNSYTSRSLLGNSWRSDEFETIYDVPLDGTYHFHVFDSGQRGLGSINGITCHKKAKEIVELNKTIDCYTNSPDFVSTIKYYGLEKGVQTEFYIDGVCCGSDIEPIFENFNQSFDLINDLCPNIS